MPASARENYLSTMVLTAPPQKLHLMLIDAAIRFTEQTRQQWQAGEREAGFHSLMRAQRIVTELLTSLNREASPSLVGKMAGVYLFIFRSLSGASVSRSCEKLDDALRVLQTERETWHLLCERLADTADDRPAVDAARLDLAESAVQSPPKTSHTPLVFTDDESLPAGGFSLEV